MRCGTLSFTKQPDCFYYSFLGLIASARGHLSKVPAVLYTLKYSEPSPFMIKNIELVYIEKTRMRMTHKSILWEPLVERLDTLEIRDLLLSERYFECFDIGM